MYFACLKRFQWSLHRHDNQPQSYEKCTKNSLAWPPVLAIFTYSESVSLILERGRSSPLCSLPAPSILSNPKRGIELCLWYMSDILFTVVYAIKHGNVYLSLRISDFCSNFGRRTAKRGWNAMEQPRRISTVTYYNRFVYDPCWPLKSFTNVDSASLQLTAYSMRTKPT